MTAPVILIEASPRRVSDAAVQTVRLAGCGGVLPYYYDGVHYKAGVIGLPTIVTALDYRGDDLGTGAVPQALEIGWAAATPADAAAYAAYYWRGASITVRVGPEGTSPPAILTGKVLEASASGGVLRIAMADPAADLQRPVLVNRFDGSGGIEGPVAWGGRIKPRAWGRVYNVEGEPLDPANNIYCFGDPAYQWQSIDAVRDKGAPAASLTSVAWQGSVAATFAALQAAVAPQGGGVKCPSIACVKWWTQPAGALTADIKGEIGSGYVETAPEIAARIVAARTGPAFAAGTVAAAAALRPGAAGYLADSESVTIAEVLDYLLGSVSLLWVLEAAGTIRIRPWAWGASVASAVSHDVSRRDVFAPVKTRRIGYQRNAHVMGRGDIAAAVLSGDLRGEWATATAYQLGNIVTDGNPASSYLCILGHSSDAAKRPPNATYWQVLAGAGADGLSSYTLTNRTPGNLKIAGRRIEKIAGAGAWNASAVSGESYRGGAAVSWTSDVVGHHMVGLSATPAASDGYETIGYAIYVNATGWQVYESGVSKYVTATPPANGDRWTVHYRGRDVVYSRNGVPFHVSTGVAPEQTLFLDTSLHDLVTLSDIVFTPAPASKALGMPTLINAGNVTIDGNSIWKSSGADAAWNASAHSSEGYVGGAYVSWSPAQTNKYFMVGLTADPEASVGYDTMDYALEVTTSGTLYYWENGVGGALGASYAAGDVLAVQYVPGAVLYMRNGKVLRTVSVTINVPLYLDSSFYHSGARANNLIFAAAPMASPGASAIGFIQDTNPGSGQFDGQTWYKPTNKEWYRWTGSAWSRILGDLSAKDLIASSAYIADGVILKANIGDLQVDTIKIANNSVTIPISAFTSGSISADTYGATVQSASITSTGAPITIMASLASKSVSGSLLVYATVQILRDSTVIFSSDTAGYTDRPLQFSASLSDAPGAGTYTYSIKVTRTSGALSATVTNRSLVLLETKK